MPNKYASSNWPFFLRKIILLALTAFIAVLGLIIFLGSKGKRLSPPQTESVSSGDVQSLEENFTAFELTESGGRITIKANLASVDREKNQELKGKVEFFQEKPDFELVLKAQEAVIDPGRRTLRARGSVEVKTEAMQLSSPLLTYELKSGLLEAENLKLNIKDLEILASEANYDFNRQQGQLQAEAMVKVQDLREPLIMTARRMRFDLKAGLIQAEGVKFENGPMSGMAAEARLVLDRVNYRPEEIALNGKAVLDLRQEENDTSFPFIRLAASKIILVRQQASWLLKAPDRWEIKAKGSSREMEGCGENIELLINADGEAVSFMARKTALSFFQQGEKEIELQAEKIVENLLTGEIQLLSEARLVSTGLRLEASSLQFELSDLSFKADEGKIQIDPVFFKISGIFFKEELPLLAAGSGLSRLGGKIELSHEVNLWQGENHFLAGLASFYKDTGIIELKNGVKANLIYRRSGTALEKAGLSAGELSFLPSRRALQASKDVCFLPPGLKLQADLITFYFEKDNSDELTRLEIGGPVHLTWNDYEFNSQEAIYSLEKETFVFSGLARLKDKEGNLVEADKLTLLTLDDKIIVENQGRKRSVTILRRGK
ncbi:MAG: hypothetical protein PHU81_09400 [Acidobacteriota bacterium]|nr:hypothetical protein [Acidobacteriota bacterium]